MNRTLKIGLVVLAVIVAVYVVLMLFNTNLTHTTV